MKDGYSLPLVIFGPSIMLYIFYVIYLCSVNLRNVIVKRESRRAVPRGNEPALQTYFIAQSWIDLVAVFVRNTRSLIRATEKTIVICGFNIEVENGLLRAICFIGVGALGIVVFSPVAAIALPLMSALLIVASIIHFLIIALPFVWGPIVAYLLRAVEYVTLRLRGVFFSCPHTGCHERIALPIYLCPTCGAEHRRLVPGIYGLFVHRCKCGSSLPTMTLLGRARLESLCPRPACHRRLHSLQGEARNLHVALVGGATAGKTSLLAAIQAELARRAAHGPLKLEFLSTADERQWRKHIDCMATGALVDKTPEYSPTALPVMLTNAHGDRIRLNLYDAAGELYQDNDRLQGQNYYSYLHGILFVLDALSLPEVMAERNDPWPERVRALSPSVEHPEAVYERIAQALRSFRGEIGQIKLPLAVVVTKIDALEPSALGSDAMLQSAVPPDVRSWLARNGQGNFLRSMERDFAQVRYFAASALGRVPDRKIRQPFLSQHALPPLAWLLRANGFELDLRRQLLVADESPRIAEAG
jgi:hypothetical protein